MPPKASKSTDREIDRAWADGFVAHIYKARSPQGTGWLTYVEVLDKYKLGRNRTYTMLNSLVRKGLMEKYVGLQQIGKRACRQIWYRPVALKDDKTR